MKLLTCQAKYFIYMTTYCPPNHRNSLGHSNFSGLLRGRYVWEGKTLSTWIAQQWGVELGVRQCQYLFRQLGFRLRKPRPLIARADPERQRTHKKDSRP